MTEEERYRLRFGKYRTPRFKMGDVVICSARGQVTIVGMTNGKIPWPIGKTKRARSPVLYQDLERAVRKEAFQAIIHWWGVCWTTVWKWRKALGLGQYNEGTRTLKKLHFGEPWAEDARKKAWAKSNDPARREKIATSRRGKSRPPHVIEAMRKGRTGKPQSEETKKKMRQAHSRRKQEQL